MNDLETILDFDTEELSTNRAGKLSSYQRTKLERSRLHSLFVLILMCAFVVVVLMVGLFFGGIILAIFGITALLCAILGLVEYFLGYDTYRRDINSEIASIQGQLHYVRRSNTILGIETHPSAIRIGDVSFLLLVHQVEAFQEGDIYSVYYAPRTHTLLSAERIMRYDTPDEIADEAYIADDMQDHRPLSQSRK
ncbi:MAG: hypothetical protein Q9P44_00875 [Anaerolineae bacterium]|nr:hypothetical protein [Anaerolineae bacterium]